MTRLTLNFTLKELVASDTAEAQGIDNTPDADQIVNLYRLALELEKIREHIFGGRPLHINSGFRCPDLNDAVGGSRNSFHKDACAADFDPPADMTHDECQHAIANDGEIVFDLILEEGTTKPESEGGSRWLHFQIARRGEPARRMVRDATVDRLGGTITRVAAG